MVLPGFPVGEWVVAGIPIRSSNPKHGISTLQPISATFRGTFHLPLPAS